MTLSETAATAPTSYTPGTDCWYLQSTRRYRCRIHGQKVYYCRWQRVRVFCHSGTRVGVFLIRDGQVLDERGSTRYVAPTSLSRVEPPEGAEVIR